MSRKNWSGWNISPPDQYFSGKMVRSWNYDPGPIALAATSSSKLGYFSSHTSISNLALSHSKGQSPSLARAFSVGIKYTRMKGTKVRTLGASHAIQSTLRGSETTS